MAKAIVGKKSTTTKVPTDPAQESIESRRSRGWECEELVTGLLVSTNITPQERKEAIERYLTSERYQEIRIAALKPFFGNDENPIAAGSADEGEMAAAFFVSEGINGSGQDSVDCLNSVVKLLAEGRGEQFTRAFLNELLEKWRTSYPELEEIQYTARALKHTVSKFGEDCSDEEKEAIQVLAKLGADRCERLAARALGGEISEEGVSHAE